MQNRWNDSLAMAASGDNEALAAQAYASRILGAEADLALHGGGNTSVKADITDRTGARRKALFVKASGCDLARMTALDFIALDQEHLVRLRAVQSLSDDEMAEEFRCHQLMPHPTRASIEALLHAFLPFTFVTHTHPAAILALTNRIDGEALISQALGDAVAVIPYTRVGLDLAQAAATAIEKHPQSTGLVVMHHGLVTWGESARAAYDATIETVGRAERFLQERAARPRRRPIASDATAQQMYKTVAPVLRGMLSPARGDDRGRDGVVLQPLLDPAVREVVDSDKGEHVCVSAPLTPDLIVRAGLLPLWIESPSFNDLANFRKQLAQALERFGNERAAYVRRHDPARADALMPAELLPRVVFLPGVGCVCTGGDTIQAGVAADIARQAVATKTLIADSGGQYAAMAEEHLFDMEFRSLQRAKVETAGGPLAGKVAMVTGSAGAIGRGIAAALLRGGCHVALADLPGEALTAQADEYGRSWPQRALATPMDVTDAASVAAAFDAVVARWGGLDIVIVNAGIAHVSALADMDLEAFRRLERVNVDGTLLTLRESARLFATQQIGGDIVLVSTKNVFAPGAKFGAYSATKAAAHQLARIAVVEMADMDVRVNMVAPDAVFSHGATRSGLWATVGPDRMRARGLDEKGLEEYYRGRNLLKAKVTADHVANAVMFFVTRQTPTTGATIPVDGGLPDATPR